MLDSDTGKLVAAMGQSGLAKGIKAGSIIRAAAKALGGGGGGPNVVKLDEASQSDSQVLLIYPQRC